MICWYNGKQLQIWPKIAEGIATSPRPDNIGGNLQMFALANDAMGKFEIS